MSFNTLSGRILTLMAVFVVIAEVLFFVPSMARFRFDYLQSRLDLGQIAALAMLATPPDQEVPPDLQQKLLAAAGVLNIAFRRDDVRELMTTSPIPPMVERTYYLDTDNAFHLMRDAMRVFVRGGDRIIRVVGVPSQGGALEITLHEQPLRDRMIDQGRRILYVSLAISLATAALLFLAVQRLIVRPIDRVARSMTAYRDDPEDASRIITPESGAREIRQAEAALQELEVRLTAALKQKERLAGLGGAVAKISHDLRNMLTTAQIMADRLEMSADPAAVRTVPKLLASLARAINLCERTLAYGKAEELPPEPTVFPLRPLVLEVLENEQASAPARCAGFEAEVPETMTVRADADQLFRVLSNLVRNAAQAIEASRASGRISVRATETVGRSEIRVIDTGPGLPLRARENLFQPFRGGVRQGGTGLGLVIAAEIVRGHGGSLDLEETGAKGSTFRISLPAPPGKS